MCGDQIDWGWREEVGNGGQCGESMGYMGCVCVMRWRAGVNVQCGGAMGYMGCGDKVGNGDQYDGIMGYMG